MSKTDWIASIIECAEQEGWSEAAIRSIYWYDVYEMYHSDFPDDPAGALEEYRRADF